MEAQALKTDAAVQSVGDSLDDVGTREHMAHLEGTNKQLKEMDKTTEHLGGSSGGLSKTRRETDGLTKSNDRLNTSVTRTGLKLAAFGKILAALKIPFVVSAVASLVAGVSALGGGLTSMLPQLGQWAGSLVSLIPNLGRLGSLAAAAIPSVIGLGGAFLGARLAFSGFGAAVSEGGKALADLEPRAQRVARVLRGVGKDFADSVKAQASNSFFGSFNASQMEQILSKQNRTQAKSLVGTGAQTAGMAATQATDALINPTVLADLNRIMARMQPVILMLTSAFTDLARAALDVGVAALPLTRWLAQTISGWASYWRELARVGRETGSLAKKFETAWRVAQQFGRILKNVWGVLGDVLNASSKAGDSLWNAAEMGTRKWEEWTSSFEGKNVMADWFNHARESASTVWSTIKNLGRGMNAIGLASRDVGDELWKQTEQITGRWADWANSFKGQTDMARWFEAIKRPMQEISGLIADLGKAFVRLGTAGGLTETFEILRRGVEPLEKLFAEIGKNLAPTFAESLVQILTLMSNLTEAGSPFIALGKLMNSFMIVLNKVVDTIPGLGTLLGVTLGAVALRRAYLGINLLAQGWMRVTAAALEAAAANQAAMASAMGGRGAVVAGPVGRGGQRSPGTGTTQKPGGSGGPAVLGGFGGRAAGKVGGSLAGRAAGAAGRFAGRWVAPAVALWAASDILSAPDGLQGKAGTAAEWGSMGIFDYKTNAEKTEMGTAQGQHIADRVFKQTGTKTPFQLQQASDRLERIIKSSGSIFDQQQAMADNLAVKGGRNVDPATGRRLVPRGMVPRTPDEIEAAQGRIDKRNRLSGMPEEAKAAREAALRSARQQAQRAADRTSLATAGDVNKDIGGAFKIAKDAFGLEKAMRLTTRGVLQEIGPKLGDAGSMALAKTRLQWMKEQAKLNPELLGTFQKLQDGVQKKFRDMGKNIRVINGEIYDGSNAQWNRIREALGTQTEKMKQKTTEGFTYMQQKAVNALTTMGYSQGEAKSIVTHGGEIGAGTGAGLGNAAANAERRGMGNSGGKAKGARGMRIPGLGRQDNVPLMLGMAAPGELIVNRHTERDVDRDLMGAGKPPLGRRVAGEGRRHSEGYAKGGRLASGHPELNTAMQGLEARLAAKGFTAGSTTGGTHAPGSYHYSGSAIDYGDASNNMQSLWSVLRPMARSFAELFGPSGMRPGPTLMHNGQGFSDAALQAQHEDHIHVALTGGKLGKLGAGGAGGGAAMRQALRIKAAKTGMKGVPGALGDQTLKILASGMEDKINQRIGGGQAGGPVDLSGGVRSWLTQALRITGHYSPANLQALYGRAMQESGGNPRSVNNWDSNAAAGTPSKGLLQTIDPTFDQYKMKGYGNIFNPVHNAVAAIRYMFGRYGHIVGPSSTGYATGGRVPDFGGWFGGGGHFDVDGATMIGVGEKGKERVKVTPAGKSAGRGGGDGISIGQMTIHNNRPGDIRRQVERELDQAFSNFAEKVASEGNGVVA